MCLFSHPTSRENHVYKPVIFYLFYYVSMKPQLLHKGSQQAKKNPFKAFFQRCAQQNHYLYSCPLNLQKPQHKEGYTYLLVLVLKYKVNLYIYVMSALHFLKGLINRLIKKILSPIFSVFLLSFLSSKHWKVSQYLYRQQYHI